MTLAAQLLTDLDAIFNTDEFAQAVTYNGLSIDAVDSYAELMGDEGGSVKRQHVIYVKTSDVGAPAYRDTVVISGVTWYVGPENEHEDQGGVWKLPLYRDERPVL